MARPKTVAQERDDVSWSDVLDAVDEKKEELETSTRYYQGDHRITETVIVQQESYPEKLLVLDEIKFDDDDYQFRFGYWVVSDKKLEQGKIAVVFGQFASVIPPEDLRELLQKAERADWNGPPPC